MKVDTLFLERGCSHCGAIRAILDMDAVESDDFQGSEGQAFHVFSSQSNGASKELLAKFDLEGNSIPLLVKHDGDVLLKPSAIQTYLKESGMATT